MNAQNDNSNQQLQRKQCHGNRRDQRFRKQRRALGMKPENIEKKLARRKQIEKLKNSTKNNDKHTTDSVTNLTKRNPEISLQQLNTNHILAKSTSSISMAQPLTKKTKKEMNKTILHSFIVIINDKTTNMNYRLVILFIHYQYVYILSSFSFVFCEDDHSF